MYQEYDSHKIEEEILELLYTNLVEHRNITEDFIINQLSNFEVDLKKSINTLLDKGLLIKRDNSIILSPKGEEIGRSITRRNRLAERLFNDVLELKNKDIVETACKFEHIISPDVEEAICTLLGHPTVCPHGKPIPQGKCCEKDKKIASSINLPLSQLKAGESAIIRYIKSEHKENAIKKIINMGLLPGTKIHVIQTDLAIIIKIDSTTLAMDRNLADMIQVRRILNYSKEEL